MFRAAAASDFRFALIEIRMASIDGRSPVRSLQPELPKGTILFESELAI
jgi:hypothetical protein